MQTRRQHSGRVNSLEMTSMMQQRGGSAGEIIKAIQDMSKWKVIKDISIANQVPSGSRMPVKMRTFKAGETVLGNMECLDGSICFIKVEDGLIYHFPARGALTPLEVDAEQNSLSDDESMRNQMDDDTSMNKSSFFNKNKKPIIIGLALLVAFIGYKMMKKNK